MSLQVWLPLTGSLENQGLSNVKATGTMSYSTAGKIGKCATLNNTHILTIPYASGPAYDFTFSFWIKIPTAMNTNTGWETMMSFRAINTANSTTVNTITMDFASYHQVKIYSDSNHQHNWRTPTYDTWEHWSIVHHSTSSSSNIKLYIDGVLIGEYTTANPLILQNGNIYFGNTVSVDSFYLNDIRIYDHCLSQKEVREIAKGLIVHYPLKDFLIQTMTNSYSYPTFDTSASGGGWNHWGRTGAVGSQSQNTNKTYIYDKTQTYSHLVSNSSSATGEYLLYQAPDFSGGVRSVQCIVKETNSLPITESIVFPAWNANVAGGATNGKWTSISHLGDGFYLCKTEGIKQDGSNNLVGFYVCPGYSVYFSYASLENDKSICSDIYNGSCKTEYDCSGFGNDGTINGDVTINIDSPRYSSSYSLGSSTGSITIGNLSTLVPDGIFTMNIWFKKITGSWSSKNWETIFGGPSGFELEMKSGSTNSPVLYLYSWGKGTYTYTLDTWHMLTMVRTTTESKYYIDGALVLTGTAGTIPSGNYFFGAWSGVSSQNFMGQISDGRIYATALTEDDIKLLYRNQIQIDDDEKVFSYEFKEV